MSARQLLSPSGPEGDQHDGDDKPSESPHQRTVPALHELSARQIIARLPCSSAYNKSSGGSGAFRLDRESRTPSARSYADQTGATARRVDRFRTSGVRDMRARRYAAIASRGLLQALVDPIHRKIVGGVAISAPLLQQQFPGSVPAIQRGLPLAPSRPSPSRAGRPGGGGWAGGGGGGGPGWCGFGAGFLFSCLDFFLCMWGQ
jgi:hypothetical protein